MRPSPFGHHRTPAPVAEPVPLDAPQPIVDERRRVQPLAEQPLEILFRYFLGDAAERILVHVLQVPAREICP